MPVNNLRSTASRFTVGRIEIEDRCRQPPIPQPVSLPIRTPARMVRNTADWKIDPEPENRTLTDESPFPAATGDEWRAAINGAIPLKQPAR